MGMTLPMPKRILSVVCVIRHSLEIALILFGTNRPYMGLLVGNEEAFNGRTKQESDQRDEKTEQWRFHEEFLVVSC